jgi:carboxyl-terminal processing protease
LIVSDQVKFYTYTMHHSSLNLAILATNMMQRTRWSLGWFVYCLSLSVALMAGAEESPPPEKNAPALSAEPELKQATVAEPDPLKLFTDTYEQVERNYVREVDRRQLMEAAIRGMLSKLDPYSTYISPTEIDQFRASVENEFGGVGIQVSVDSGELTVVSPILNTPAYKAGIRAGDVVVSIAGKSTTGITVEEAVKLMKGKIGSTIDVVVKHGEAAPETLALARETIHLESVIGDHRNADHTWNYWLDESRKIGYIHVTGFGRHTVNDLKAVLQPLQEQGLKALVLDLRNNPGGLLTAAIEVADLFLPAGRIVSTAGRKVPEQAWEATRPSNFETLPLAVIVNRYSASASEIVSAALQDHERAVIVGERTWGKGSVQNIIELEQGRSALKLTTSGYKRPSGKNIHRLEGAKEDEEWGVRPSPRYEVLLEEADIKRIFKWRQTRDAIRRPDDKSTESLPADLFTDPQRDKAIEYVREKLGDPVPAPPQPPAAG